MCKSHIIPEFIYASLYDSNHRFIEVTDVSAGKVTRGQKGYWERLLCASCEARISRHERHARRLFTDPLPPHVRPSKMMRHHPRIEYRRLKLFFLSILWRASESSHPVFKHVNLGPHAEHLRTILLTENPGGIHDYATMVWVLNFKGVHLRDYIVEPTHVRYSGRKCYRFVFGGFVVFIFVANQPSPEPFSGLVLDPEHPVRTYDAEMRDFLFLRETWNQTAQTTKDVKI